MQASKELKEQAHKLYLKTTRKLPNSPHRTAKTEKELTYEIRNRKKNFAKGPKCFKTPIAIDEKKKHNGASCQPGEERTKNYCVKKLSPPKTTQTTQTTTTPKKLDPTQFRWFRVISPNKNTRITLACPK